MIVPKLSEENINEYVEQLISRTNGQYITQGVSFNKSCPRQMELLKMALLESASFSGLIKELLALNFKGSHSNNKAAQINEVYSHDNKMKSVKEAWL